MAASPAPPSTLRGWARAARPAEHCPGLRTMLCSQGHAEPVCCPPVGVGLCQHRAEPRGGPAAGRAGWAEAWVTQGDSGSHCQWTRMPGPTHSTSMALAPPFPPNYPLHPAVCRTLPAPPSTRCPSSPRRQAGQCACQPAWQSHAGTTCGLRLGDPCGAGRFEAIGRLWRERQAALGSWPPSLTGHPSHHPHIPPPNRIPNQNTFP